MSVFISDIDTDKLNVYFLDLDLYEQNSEKSLSGRLRELKNKGKNNYRQSKPLKLLRGKKVNELIHSL